MLPNFNGMSSERDKSCSRTIWLGLNINNYANRILRLLRNGKLSEIKDQQDTVQNKSARRRRSPCLIPLWAWNGTRSNLTCLWQTNFLDSLTHSIGFFFTSTANVSHVLLAVPLHHAHFQIQSPSHQYSRVSSSVGKDSYE